MKPQRRIKIGTRGSALALAQTNQVVEALQAAFPDITAETVVLNTKGDRIPDKPLPEFGGKGVFVEEFEQALLTGQIDLAVHSAKDMPVELSGGLTIAGALKREDARDVLVMQKNAEKEEEMVIGTGSLRRKLQLQKIYPKAVCKGIRGNVPTRLKKLRQKEYDAVVLAAAGLKRLGLLDEEDLEYRYFSYDEVVPAAGQAIIAIEGRQEDAAAEMVKEISDARAAFELMLERSILQLLDGGCHEAIGAFAQCTEDSVRIRIIREVGGMLRTEDGTAEAAKGQELAVRLAMRIKQGLESR